MKKRRIAIAHLETREDVQPICPHCSAALATLWMQLLRGIFGKRYVYLCPNCRKILGISHRKGFWTG